MAKTPAERQADKRKRDKAHLAEMEQELIPLTVYKGTRASLDILKKLGDFEQDEEVITLLIRNADIILKRDMSQLNSLLGFN
jgi:hypothetical protein